MKCCHLSQTRQPQMELYETLKNNSKLTTSQQATTNHYNSYHDQSSLFILKHYCNQRLQTFSCGISRTKKTSFKTVSPLNVCYANVVNCQDYLTKDDDWGAVETIWHCNVTQMQKHHQFKYYYTKLSTAVYCPSFAKLHGVS